jgi:pimeloyl-ACP methyl ester carboxylesterase
MGKGTWAALPARQHATMLAHGRQTFFEVRALCHDRTPAAAWRPIRCPVAITCGEESPKLEVRVCELVTDAIDGAVLTRLPGGHMGPITNAEAFEAVVFETLERAS